MGTDMMGQFAATGALEPVPANFEASTFFESAWNTNIVDGTLSGVPWYVETRLLYYRTDIAEKAGITAPPATWDDLKTMATAMQAKGGAKWGISLGTPELAGIPALPVVQRRGRHGRVGGLSAQQPAGRRSPHLLQLVLHGGPVADGSA